MIWGASLARRTDRGSATVHAMTALTVLVLAAVVAASVGSVVVGHRRAAAAADLAALAGAQSVQTGMDPCQAAASIAARNRAELGDCRVSGRQVDVQVTIAVRTVLPRAVTVVGNARAGPVTPGRSW